MVSDLAVHQSGNLLATQRSNRTMQEQQLPTEASDLYVWPCGLFSKCVTSLCPVKIGWAYYCQTSWKIITRKVWNKDIILDQLLTK